MRKTKGPDLHVWGSSNLLQTLIKARLVDEHQIWIFPAVLGYGKRSFEPGTPPHRLKLVETKSGSGGVIINTYRQDGSVPSKPMVRIKAKQAEAGQAQPEMGRNPTMNFAGNLYYFRKHAVRELQFNQGVASGIR